MNNKSQNSKHPIAQYITLNTLNNQKQDPVGLDNKWSFQHSNHDKEFRQSIKLQQAGMQTISGIY